MKKFLLLIAFSFVFVLPVHAQMMGGFNTGSTTSADTQTSPDSEAGKAIWDKLQNKQTTCTKLSDDDFDLLGDFFMSGMMGSSHEAMDSLMTQRLGADGEKQMHIVMGKRLSGCDTSVAYPQGANYFMPMMAGLQNSNDNWNQRGMMGGNYRTSSPNAWSNSSQIPPFAVMFVLGWLVVMTDFVLAGVWLWKQIRRTK